MDEVDWVDGIEWNDSGFGGIMQWMQNHRPLGVEGKRRRSDHARD